MHTCADCVPALHEFRSDWIDRCMDGGMDKITLIWRFACEKSGCCWSHKLQWLFFFFLCFSFFFFFLLSSSFSPRLLRRPFFLLSPSSSWGACAGLPRPYLGWCPSVGVRVLLAAFLPLLLLLSSFFFLLLFRPVFFVVLSSFCLPPLLGVHVLVYHVLTWGGVPVSGCVCCWPRPFPFLPLLLLLLFLCPVSFCLPPLLGVRVLVYHVLTWGGVPLSGCVCCWPRPFPFLPLLLLFLLLCPVSFCLPPLLGVRVLVYHVLTWGGVPLSGCMCCWPRPFLFCFCFFLLLLLLLFRPVFFVPSLLSVSFLFFGACAGSPRPDLGWCHSVGVRVFRLREQPKQTVLVQRLKIHGAYCQTNSSKL